MKYSPVIKQRPSYEQVQSEGDILFVFRNYQVNYTYTKLLYLQYSSQKVYYTKLTFHVIICVQKIFVVKSLVHKFQNHQSINFRTQTIQIISKKHTSLNLQFTLLKTLVTCVDSVNKAKLQPQLIHCSSARLLQQSTINLQRRYSLQREYIKTYQFQYISITVHLKYKLITVYCMFFVNTFYLKKKVINNNTYVYLPKSKWPMIYLFT